MSLLNGSVTSDLFLWANAQKVWRVANDKTGNNTPASARVTFQSFKLWSHLAQDKFLTETTDSYSSNTSLSSPLNRQFFVSGRLVLKVQCSNNRMFRSVDRLELDVGRVCCFPVWHWAQEHWIPAAHLHCHVSLVQRNYQIGQTLHILINWLAQGQIFGFAQTVLEDLDLCCEGNTKFLHPAKVRGSFGWNLLGLLNNSKQTGTPKLHTSSCVSLQWLTVEWVSCTEDRWHYGHLP